MSLNKTQKKMIEHLSHVYCEHVPFHKLIGFKFHKLNMEECRISFDSKPELIGNFVKNILHGGVTATALDVAGGLMAAVGMLAKDPDATEKEMSEKIAKVGTIDIRIDYVRPGRGESFYATAKLLKCGNQLAVVRMELHNDKDSLIALGPVDLSFVSTADALFLAIKAE